MMRYTSSLLALALASAKVVSAESLGRDFTVNLLTQVQDLSINFPQFPDQVPIHWNNASIKHVYGDVTYSVVGSLNFNETYVKQTYHIENDQWSSDVDVTLIKPGTVSHLDIAVSKDEPNGTKMRFDYLSLNVTDVWVDSVPVNTVPK